MNHMLSLLQRLQAGGIKCAVCGKYSKSGSFELIFERLWSLPNSNVVSFLKSYAIDWGWNYENDDYYYYFNEY